MAAVVTSFFMQRIVLRLQEMIGKQERKFDRFFQSFRGRLRVAEPMAWLANYKKIFTMPMPK